ncbi:hypothetical protein FQN50_006992 [Emmonsiellopsis sp. PD_5]|nr:hypothetical protein FQN50_006992 [Emmonsiellopsis sp. PD_5]
MSERNKSAKTGLRAGYVSQLEQRIADLEQEFRLFKHQIPQADQQIETEAPRQHLEGNLQPLTVSLQDDASSWQTAASTGEQGGSHQDFQRAAGYDTGLTSAMLAEFCTIWFEKYHPWFPILHQPTVSEYCQQLQQGSSSDIPLTLKAMAAVILPVYCPHPSVDPTQWKKRSEWVRDEVTLAAIHNLSLESLQALLIISIAEFGDGRLSEYWNLIALCKRMSTQLGLRDLVAHQCANFAVSSSHIPPRMLSVPSTTVELEEKIRAFWATQALDSASTLGVAWHLGVSKPELAASLPCSDDIWGFSEALVSVYRFINAEGPSCFSLFVRLVTNELWHVHNFLQQPYLIVSEADVQQKQKDCMAVDQLLADLQKDFNDMLTLNLPPCMDLFSNDTVQDQHQNSVLIHCTIDSAIISLYQRSILPTHQSNSDLPRQPWKHAVERCQQSYIHMGNILRNANESILASINPLIIYSIFVSARYCIIYHKAMDLDVPYQTHFLISALTICGQRWSLARQLQKVLAAAMFETNVSIPTRNPLPEEFYDLQYFSLDIAEALKEWYEPA